MSQPGLIYTFDDSKIQKLVQRLIKKMSDLTPAMEEIGETGVASIQKNFEEGGRPGKWKNLSDSTIRQRKKLKKWPGQILVRSGEMKRISYQAEKRKTILSPANVPQAAIHHFGGNAGRNRKVLIPARPYLLLQKEDEIEIKAILADFVLKGEG